MRSCLAQEYTENSSSIHATADAESERVPVMEKDVEDAIKDVVTSGRQGLIPQR
jgi:hypothetical protein